MTYSLTEAYAEHAEHEVAGEYDLADGPADPRPRRLADPFAPDFTDAVCIRVGAQQAAASAARIPRPYTNDRSPA